MDVDNTSALKAVPFQDNGAEMTLTQVVTSLLTAPARYSHCHPASAGCAIESIFSSHQCTCLLCSRLTQTNDAQVLPRAASALPPKRASPVDRECCGTLTEHQANDARAVITVATIRTAPSITTSITGPFWSCATGSSQCGGGTSTAHSR